MTWAERLFRLATADTSAETNVALLQLHGAFRDRSRLLASHADLAPNAAAEQDLRELAREQEALADEVRQALAAREVPIIATGAAPGAGSGRNHWARLVEDLEAMRQTRAWLMGEGVRMAEADPRLEPLFGSLRRGLDAHLAVLRALIARADPQALD